MKIKLLKNVRKRYRIVPSDNALSKNKIDYEATLFAIYDKDAPSYKKNIPVEFAYGYKRAIMKLQIIIRKEYGNELIVWPPYTPNL